MGRFDHRLRRLEQQVRGRHATPWQARVARMGYEELQAEIVRTAVALGCPEDLTAADPGAVLQWLHDQALSAVDGLPEEEQSEWRVQLEAFAKLATGPW